MTAPYAAGTDTRLPDGFELLAHATLTDGVNEWPLDVDEWELTVDEEREPHAELRLTIAIPDADTLDNLDARLVRWIEFQAGYRWPDETEDLQDFARLRLYARSIRRPDGRIDLTCYSDEARIDDANIPVDHGTGTPLNFTTAVQQISHFLDGGTLNTSISNLVMLPAEYPMTGVDPQAITDQMETVRAWADAIDAVVYCNQLGIWQLHRAPTLGRARAILTTGPRGVITAIDDRLTRTEGWASHLILTYNDPDHDPRWWAELDDTQPGELERVEVIERQDPPRGATAAGNGKITDPAIKGLMRRVRDRASIVQVTIAAHLWLRVHDTVTIATPDRDQQRVLIAAITTTSSGTQIIRTRKPDA